MNQQEYYNFMNLENYLSKKGINYDDTYFRWVKDIINTKVGMFTYDNLPYQLTSQIMELSLLFNNFLCFYYDKKIEQVILCRYIYAGDFNLYWKPITVTLLTISGKPVAYNVPYEDIVLIRDNTMDIIPFITLNGWINKIIEVERTINAYLTISRLPAVFQGSKESVSTLKLLIKKAIDFEPIAIMDKALTADIFKQFDIKFPTTLEDLYNLLRKYKELALSSIGIYSVDEKRERIVTQEIITQNDYVDFVYSDMYNNRKNAIDEINKKFNLNIKLNETYIENKKDEMKLNKESIVQQEDAKAKAQIKVEEVKNDGKIAVARIESESDNNVLL